MRIHRHWLHFGLLFGSLGMILLVVFGRFAGVDPSLARTNLALQPATAMPYLAALIEASDLIIRGQVVTLESKWNAEHSLIETENHIAVRYALLGKPPVPLLVRTLGGELPNEDLALDVSHIPHLVRAEEVLLFLQATPDGYRITRQEAGKFRIANGVAVNQQHGVQLAYEDLLAELTQKITAQGKAVATPMDWRALEPMTATGNGLLPQGFVYKQRKWPGVNPEVKYKININTNQAGGVNGSVADFQAAIQNAAATWNNVAQAEFTLRYDGESHTTDVNQSNKENEIIFMHQGSDGLLGLGFVWFKKSDPTTIVEADIWLNDDFLFDATGSPAATEYDLQSAVLHEFGHWLALGHDDQADTVMFPLLGVGVLHRDLHANDMAGIQCLYNGTGTDCNPPTPTPISSSPTPTVEPATPTPTATPSPRGPTNHVMYLPLVRR